MLVVVRFIVVVVIRRLDSVPPPIIIVLLVEEEAAAVLDARVQHQRYMKSLHIAAAAEDEVYGTKQHQNCGLSLLFAALEIYKCDRNPSSPRYCIRQP